MITFKKFYNTDYYKELSQMTFNKNISIHLFVNWKKMKTSHPDWWFNQHYHPSKYPGINITPTPKMVPGRSHLDAEELGHIPGSQPYTNSWTHISKILKPWNSIWDVWYSLPGGRKPLWHYLLQSLRVKLAYL